MVGPQLYIWEEANEADALVKFHVEIFLNTREILDQLNNQIVVCDKQIWVLEPLTKLATI